MEFDRLDRLRPFLTGSSAAVPVGVGDDAAVVLIGGAQVVVCTDTVVEGVHFRRDLSLPGDVGWKSLAVNVSDIAAMGAKPTAAVIGLNRTASLTEADIDAFYAGLAQAASAYDVAIVGGDTVTAGQWSVTVTVLGDLQGRPAVLRQGARPGDAVVLAGPLGAATAALWAQARGSTALPEHLGAHRRPDALPATGQALAAVGVTSMIDLSDGLGADAAHVCRASQVSMHLQSQLLQQRLAPGVHTALGGDWLHTTIGGGEDFALLSTIPTDLVEGALAAVAAAGETTAAVIGSVGEVEPGGLPTVWLSTPGGAPQRIDELGYDHG
ncbi:MAG: thiamine-phosphate kinase [Euzebya sp.]